MRQYLKLATMLGFAGLLGSCAGGPNPQFQRYTNGFLYTVEAYEGFTYSDPTADLFRMGYLKHFLQESNHCPNGYEIIKHETDPEIGSSPNRSYVLYYYGKCLSDGN